MITEKFYVMGFSAFRVHTYNFISFSEGEQAPRAETPERWICGLTALDRCTVEDVSVSGTGLGNLLRQV